jgi:hypothetical protein
MILLYRAAVLVLLILSALALVQTNRYLAGDLSIHSLQPPNQNIPLSHAVALENSIREGLAANPLSWQGHVQRAGYLAIQQKYDAALEAINESMKYNQSMPAMFLEATIYYEIASRYRRDAPQAQPQIVEWSEKASTAFERLYRLSIVDRTVLQHLMRIYSERPKTPEGNLELLQLATETDLRWPNTFDSLVALANAHIAIDTQGYLPLILRYFILASLVHADEFSRPEPHAYEYEAVVERISRASQMTKYNAPWAKVE